MLDLLPELWVDLEPPRLRPRALGAPVRPVRVPFGDLDASGPPASDSLVLRAEASRGAARYALELVHRRGTSLVQITLEAAYSAEVSVRQESLRFTAPALDRAMVADRAYRWIPLRAASFADTLSPRIVRLVARRGALTLLGGEGVQGLWARPLPGARYQVEAELDHEANHPFRPHLRCVDRPSARVRRGDLGASLRPAGTRRQMRITLVVGEFGPAMVSRFPRGYRGALVLTDHADQSDAAKLEALAFGATGAVARGEVGPGHPGLVNRGLVFTKTIFLEKRRRYAPQFDDPVYRKLLDRMREAGVEIGVHSPTGWRDTPEAATALIRRFREAYAGRAWIDHQPVTNCEAVTSSGWDAESEWHILPLLARAGFRYLWSALDLSPSPGELNLFSPGRAAARCPILYPFEAVRLPPGASFVLFASSPLFLDRRAVLHRLSEPWLRRLEEERGLFVGHVYLDTYHRAGKFAPRSLLAPSGEPGTFVLRPEADVLFRRLAAHQAAGRLWVAGIEALAEHLLGAQQLEVDYAHPEAIMLRSRAPRLLRGVTLLLPARGGEVRVNGRPPAGLRDAGGLREVWFDVDPRRTYRIEQRDRAGTAVPFTQRNSIVLRERREP
jgi:hypothetical protein